MDKMLFPSGPGKTVAVVLFVIFFMTGCSVVEREVYCTSQVSISVQATDTSSCTVLFVPDEDVYSVVCGISSEFSSDAFDDGTVKSAQLLTGDFSQTVSFTGLESGMSYYLYARVVDESGKEGPLATLKFKTSDGDFDVSLRYCMDTSAEVLIDSDLKYSNITYYLGVPGESDKFSNGEVEVSNISESEKAALIFDGLIPGKDYALYVRPFDRMGAPGDIVELDFNTEEETPSVEFEIAEIDFYQGRYVFAPNDLCGSMSVLMGMKGAFDKELQMPIFGYCGDIFGYLIDKTESGAALMLDADGEKEVVYRTISASSGTEFEMYVLLYDKNGSPCGVQRFESVIPDEDLSLPQPSVTINVDNLSSDGFDCTISADENTKAVIYNTMDQMTYMALAPFLANDPNYINKFLVTMGEFWSYGESVIEYSETECVPGQKYYILAAPMNSNGPVDSGWGKTAVEEITIPNE